MKPKRITIEDLISEHNRLADNKGEDALTFEDLKRLTAWGEARLRRALREGVAGGRLVVVKLPCVNIVGVPMYKPAYRRANGKKK